MAANGVILLPSVYMGHVMITLYHQWSIYGTCYDHSLPSMEYIWDML